MDINFELYKIFYYAALESSFSEASKKLYITQSAVSQAVKNLEEKIGSLLFFRKTRSIKLTPEGELLFKHVEQAFNFIKSGEKKIKEMQNLNSGEVRIGVSDTICRYFLIPFLRSFTQEYPMIKFQVINRTSSQITSILKNGLVDFGIVTLPLDDKALQSSEFITVEDIFVASGRFSEIKGRKVHLKELSGFPLLMLQKNSATRRNLDRFLDAEGITLAPEIELESVDLLVEFARIGLGIAHVLRQSTEAAISRGDLFQVETYEKLPCRKLGIVTAGNVPLSEASDKFIAKLLKK